MKVVHETVVRTLAAQRWSQNFYSHLKTGKAALQSCCCFCGLIHQTNAGFQSGHQKHPLVWAVNSALVAMAIIAGLK